MSNIQCSAKRLKRPKKHPKRAPALLLYERGRPENTPLGVTLRIELKTYLSHALPGGQIYRYVGSVISSAWAGSITKSAIQCST